MREQGNIPLLKLVKCLWLGPRMVNLFMKASLSPEVVHEPWALKEFHHNSLYTLLER